MKQATCICDRVASKTEFFPKSCADTTIESHFTTAMPVTFAAYIMRILTYV